MDFLKLFNRDFGVNGRGVEFLVPEQLLNEADVGPVLEHVCGATVCKNLW